MPAKLTGTSAYPHPVLASGFITSVTQGGHELWWWMLGVFLKDDENSWRIQAHTAVSNLGSPVLNQQNVLIGIVSDSDGQKNASVIPVRDIKVLLSESKLMHSQ